MTVENDLSYLNHSNNINYKWYFVYISLVVLQIF